MAPRGDSRHKWDSGTADTSIAPGVWVCSWQVSWWLRALGPIFLLDLGGHFSTWNAQALPRSGEVGGRELY